MRIALLHYTLPPVIGGVERVIRDQAQALRMLGHEVELFDGSADALLRFRENMEGVRARRPAQTGVRTPSSASPGDGARTPSSASVSIKPGVAADERSPLQRVKEWTNYGDSSPYFEPAEEITKHRHGLPHWQQAGKLLFLTWRLADALPQEKLNELRAAKDAWELEHPRPWNFQDAEAYDQIFDDKVEGWLASGMGACVLRSPEVRVPLVETLHHRDGLDYDLLSYVVMPNYVHVLFRLRAGSALEKVLQAWKSVSSRAIGRILNQQGSLWQEGYRDRLIRGPENLEHVLRYIQKNPSKANLREGESQCWECGQSPGARTPEYGVRTPPSALPGDGGRTPQSASRSVPGGRGRPHSGHSEADEGVRAPAPYGAIIVHNVFTMPFNLLWTQELRDLAAANPDIRWFNWVHDVASLNPYYAHLPWYQPDHAQLSLPVANAVHVAVSEMRRQDYARASGLAADQIRVIPNGLDLAAVLGITERIAALDLWERQLILVHPTRLVRRKNIELGLRVTAALRDAGCKVTYALTGAPDPHQADCQAYYEELKALVTELDLAPNVLFLGQDGPLSDDDVRSLYSLADALFFPSTGEGFGLPLLEALAHRLAIFCSDLPVHQQVLGEDGQYFDVQSNPEEISARIMQWARTPHALHPRRHLWRRHEMVKICQEHLEPLLATANQSS